ncbi:ABC transporter [Streptomyces sp. CB02923]|nr:ABC transporter [Streptomyces sp. CB02923]
MLPLRPRSIVPGRQRWDVAPILRRPALARLVETTLRAVPGVHEVRANPVTGRVLVLHDRALGPRQAERLLRRALAGVPGKAAAQPASSPGPATAELTEAKVSRPSVAPTRRRLLGVAAAGLALGCGTFCAKLLLRPLVSLGVVAVATAIVIRRGWRRPDDEPPAHATGRHHPLARIIAPHRRKFGVAALLSVLGQVAETSLFMLVSFGVMTLGQGENSVLAALGLTATGSQVLFLAGAAALACVAVAGLSYGAHVSWRRLGQTVEHDWRTTTYAHVQRIAPTDLESGRTSRTSQVLTEDITQIGTFVGHTLHETIQLATCFAVMVPAFLVLAPQIAWVAFAPVPLVAWLSLRYHERAVADQTASGENRARLHARLVDNLQAGTTVKASCAEDHEEARITAMSAEHRDTNRRTDRSSVRQAQLVRLCAVAAVPGTLFAGGRAVMKGELAAEAFGPLLDLPVSALWRLNRLGPVTEQYQRTLSAFDRVQRLRALPVERDGNVPRPRGHRVGGAMALKKVSFAYPGRPATLCDLSMSIAPGQVTGIVGATGAGKTTVAKLLMRFREPDAGQVLLDGVDVADLALHDLRGAIGYVAQEPYMFDGTIADNIRYGTFDADHARLAAAARTAGADTFIETLPAGYDTVVGERGAALSGGQKQRIALARTILKNPPIVLLDEATSAVDNETEAAIQQALNTFAEDRTLVVIAHRLSTIRNAHHIYVLAPGGIVAEQGTHVELVRRGGIYAGLWQLQAGEERPVPPLSLAREAGR